MAGWLNRATDAFRKPRVAPPEPFSVRCDCGGTVGGIRVAAAQKPACPDCGTAVFVLPANVYPAPVKPIKRETPPPLPENDLAAKQGTAPTRTSAKSKKASRDTGPTTKPPPVPTPDGILDEAPMRIVTPFRMIVSAIGIIAILTGWGLWHRHRVESAKAIIPVASEAGMAAFKNGDFAVAARELARARDAVDLLGRRDADAQLIRRCCREAVAGHELSSTSLFDLLATYAADVSSGQEKGSRSLTRHRDSWLLLDAIIVNPDQASACLLDIPLVFDGIRFQVEIDSDLVRKAARRESENGVARVIFAAEMSEIRPGSSFNPDSVLMLKSKNAFLWTNIESYRELGYVEDLDEELEATRNLLTRQREQTEATR